MTLIINKEAEQTFKDLYAMASEVSLEIAKRHNPMGGLDLSETLLTSLKHQKSIYDDFMNLTYTEEFVGVKNNGPV